MRKFLAIVLCTLVAFTGVGSVAFASDAKKDACYDPPGADIFAPKANDVAYAYEANAVAPQVLHVDISPVGYGSSYTIVKSDNCFATCSVSVRDKLTRLCSVRSYAYTINSTLCNRDILHSRNSKILQHWDSSRWRC